MWPTIRTMPRNGWKVIINYEWLDNKINHRNVNKMRSQKWGDSHQMEKGLKDILSKQTKNTSGNVKILGVLNSCGDIYFF